jgi:hypothetical protein
MKVKMLRNPSLSFGCKLVEGEISMVDNAVGKALLDANIAVEIESPKPKPVNQPEIKAVPKSPAIAEVDLPKIKADPKLAMASEFNKPKTSPLKFGDSKKPQIDKE